MRRILIVLSIVAALAAQGEVINIDDETFEEALETFPIIMIKFYAPWCGHCKAMAEDYKEAARIIEERGLPFVLGEINAEANPVSKSENNIEGYPTLKLFVHGKSVPYNGDRSTKGIIDFIESRTQAPKRLENAQQIKEELERGGISVFIFAERDSEVQTIGRELSKAMEGIRFFDVESAELLSSLEETGNLPQIILIKNFDEKKNVLKEDLTVEKVRNFIEVKSEPLIGSFDELHSEKIFGGNSPAMILFRDMDGIIDEKLEGDFRKLAEVKKVTKSYFIISDLKVDLAWRVANYLGVKEEQMPIIYIIQMEGGIKKYIMDKEYPMNLEGMTKFYEDWKNHEISASMKSQPIPEKQEGAVFTLVGKSYFKEVLRSGKDVLIKFYAPWCGHCKAVIIDIYIYIYSWHQYTRTWLLNLHITRT